MNISFPLYHTSNSNAFLYDRKNFAVVLWYGAVVVVGVVVVGVGVPVLVSGR